MAATVASSSAARLVQVAIRLDTLIKAATTVGRGSTGRNDSDSQSLDRLRRRFHGLRQIVHGGRLGRGPDLGKELSCADAMLDTPDPPAQIEGRLGEHRFCADGVGDGDGVLPHPLGLVPPPFESGEDRVQANRFGRTVIPDPLPWR